jgi:hypothetical protein
MIKQKKTFNARRAVGSPSRGQWESKNNSRNLGVRREALTGGRCCNARPDPLFSKIIEKCSNCGSRMLGAYEESMVISSMVPPNFCHQCGSAFPWTPKKAMISKIQEAILDSDELDQIEKINFKENLERLKNDQLDEKSQSTLFEKIKGRSPQAWESVKPILTDILSSGIKHILGL